MNISNCVVIQRSAVITLHAVKWKRQPKYKTEIYSVILCMNTRCHSCITANLRLIPACSQPSSHHQYYILHRGKYTGAAGALLH